MCFSIVLALVMLGESEQYSSKKLFGVCIGMLIVSIGILILGIKKTAAN